MALSHVAKLTLAYRRGEATAGQVVAALDRGTPPPRTRLTDKILRRPPQERPAETEPANTWDEVLRFWDILDDRQKSELRNAKNTHDSVNQRR